MSHVCMPRNLAGLAAIAGLAAAAQGQQAGFEVSENGWMAADEAQYAAEPVGVARGAGQVPFGTEPDWVNTARRQVGALKLVDMNGDGLLDLVVGCFNSNSFPPYDDWRNFIHYNTGTELEAEPSWISADQISNPDIQIGDIDGNGWPDVWAAGGGSPRSVIYFNAGGVLSTTTGWSSAEPTSTFTTGGCLFDIDGDGDLDLVTTNQWFSPDPFRPMYFFRNTGSGLANVPSWQSAESSIQSFPTAGDADGDGDLDIAVTKWVNFQSGLYTNLGGTLDTVQSFGVGSTGADKGTAWSQIDGQGLTDLVFDGDPGGWYANQNGTPVQSGVFMPPFESPQDVAFADVDGDGDEDYAHIHFSDGRSHIYLSSGMGLSETPDWTFDSPSVGNALAFGDINGDCRVDLALGYSGDPSIRVFYNTPACPADLTGEGTLNIDDVLAYLDAFADELPAAAFAAPCDVFNIDDVLGFVDAFAGGCP